MSTFLFYDDKIGNILQKEEKPSGGAAVQAYGWIKGLHELGQKVFVLTNKPATADLKDDCRQLNLLPFYDKKKGVRWFRWLYYRLPFIYKQIKSARPDYLYQGIPGWNSFVLAMICKQLNIRYILRISNDFLVDDRFFDRYGKTHRYFQWKGLQMSHCILCQNDYQYDVITKAFPGKKAYKISNPIAFKKQDGTIGDGDRNYIAWLGLFQYQKNLKMLYQVAFLLKNEQFVVAGKEDESCDNDTRFYLEKLKELPNVTFAGFLKREEVTPFLANAKYLLNTSHFEGFSNTFLEAMSVGTPIISSSNVNPDGIISNHQLGIVYNDVDDLLKQYKAITSTEYQLMSGNVLRYVTDMHDYRLLSKKLLSMLSAN